MKIPKARKDAGKVVSETLDARTVLLRLAGLELWQHTCIAQGRIVPLDELPDAQTGSETDSTAR